VSRNHIARPRQATRLVVSCVALGLGVGTVLVASLGSDGYSSLINGISRASGIPYAAVNWTVGFVAVLLARLRGVRPGVGTIVHPVVVGLTVNAVLDLVPTPGSLTVRLVLLGVGSFVLAAGVAAYLDAGLGAGPFEAATLALDPIPFRVAYGGLQAAGALLGWLLGASIGVGTLVVVFGVGPAAAALRQWTATRRQRVVRSPSACG
jgi:uncharacterized membrane protein YczE